MRPSLLNDRGREHRLTNVKVRQCSLLAVFLVACGNDSNADGAAATVAPSNSDTQVTIASEASGSGTVLGTTAGATSMAPEPSQDDTAGTETSTAGSTNSSGTGSSSAGGAGGGPAGEHSAGASSIGSMGGTGQGAGGEGALPDVEAGGAGGQNAGGDGSGESMEPAPQGSFEDPASSTGEDAAAPMTDQGRCVVQPLSAEFRASYDDLDPFYTKYADAAGLPVVSSDAPDDMALIRVCELVIDMTMRPDVRAALIEQHVRFAIIGNEELTNDIPEFAYLPDSINERARGLGSLPAASCAEESILCDTMRDPWRGEGICVHEFAHTISLGGMYEAVPDFADRLDAAFENAQSTGLFENTYAMENSQEYWAEGVQDWYFTNLQSDPPNGIHNSVDRREELMDYDPMLYDLIAEFLPDPVQFVDCYSDE